MIKIEPTKDFSELLPVPRARAEESVQVWRVRYGSGNDSDDHTLIYFGLVSTNAICAQGVLWAQPAPALFTAPLSARKQAAVAWQAFASSYPWRMFAICDRYSARNERFLLFLGFTPYTEDEEYQYFKGAFK